MIKSHRKVSAVKSKNVPGNDSNPLNANDALGLLTASLGLRLKLIEARLDRLEAVYQSLKAIPEGCGNVANQGAVDKNLTVRAS